MSRESRALENELAALKTAYAGKEADLERLRVKQLQEELQEDDARVKQLQEELSSKDVLLRSQEQRVRELEQITTALERDVTKRGADPDGRVAAVEAENASLRARIAELEEALRAAQANSDSKKQSEAVAVLQKQVVSLQEQWKLTQQQENRLKRTTRIIGFAKHRLRTIMMRCWPGCTYSAGVRASGIISLLALRLAFRFVLFHCCARTHLHFDKALTEGNNAG